MTYLVEADQSDPGSVPWQEGCEACAVLRLEPYPSMAYWLCTVDRHMETVHDIWLINPGERM